ncbi:MAG: DUF3106 domain-containing protein [Verrucomicrobiota bacterium]|nr:DUF3106 domain-containing protein [Verrucomicrobiota bacterium]
MRLILVIAIAPFLLCTCGAEVVPPSTNQSPVAEFRMWLSLPPAEQEKAISNRPPEHRKLIQDKLVEYSGMPAAERERKLQLLELRYFLRPLLQAGPEVRTQRLERIPETYRPLISERLEQWDKLPLPLKRQILQNEGTLHYFVQKQATASTMPYPVIRPFDEKQHFNDERLAQWMKLPANERNKIYSHFNRFFDLPPAEKEKALHTLSEEERRDMEHSLKVFENLPPEQRRVCINSFSRLSQMSPAERRQFLKNAERWQTMTPRERASWRELVSSLPPLPPGFNSLGAPAPPLPPITVPIPSK